ncbi:Eaa1 [Klebsiella pneumoniae]|nr:Eaa1 [Klebsiella pneumoniae]
MNKSTITREQLIKKAQEQIEFCRHTNITGEGRAHVNQCAALFEIALAVLDSEPDCKERKLFCSTDTARMIKVISASAVTEATPLYRHAQQPVVPAELHPDTQKLVIDFCTVLAEKLYKAQLKYGYDADWKQDGWPTQCQAHFHQHIAKGDPRDVAAYCAFMWYHGWKTEATQPVTEVPKPISDRQAIVALESAGAVTPIGRAYKMDWNVCRAAMLPAAPVRSSMPDGVVTAEHRRVIEMLLSVCGAAFELADDSCQQDVDGEECHVVPSDAFQKLSDALDEIENTLPTEDIDRPDVFLTWSAVPRAALKSLLQAGNSPAQSDCCPAQNHVSPEQNGDTPAQRHGWIPVSERMPEREVDVQVYCPEKREQMVGYLERNEQEGYFRFATWRTGDGVYCQPTHWMPLPAAPQEVKGD